MWLHHGGPSCLERLSALQTRFRPKRLGGLEGYLSIDNYVAARTVKTPTIGRKNSCDDFKIVTG
jgi:hypothetical protein